MYGGKVVGIVRVKGRAHSTLNVESIIDGEQFAVPVIEETRTGNHKVVIRLGDYAFVDGSDVIWSPRKNRKVEYRLPKP